MDFYFDKEIKNILPPDLTEISIGGTLNKNLYGDLPKSVHTINFISVTKNNLICANNLPNTINIIIFSDFNYELRKKIKLSTYEFEITNLPIF